MQSRMYEFKSIHILSVSLFSHMLTFISSCIHSFEYVWISLVLPTSLLLLNDDGSLFVYFHLYDVVERGNKTLLYATVKW